MLSLAHAMFRFRHPRLRALSSCKSPPISARCSGPKHQQGVPMKFSYAAVLSLLAISTMAMAEPNNDYLRGPANGGRMITGPDSNSRRDGSERNDYLRGPTNGGPTISGPDSNNRRDGTE